MLYTIHEMIVEGGNIDTDAIDRQLKTSYQTFDSLQKDIIDRK